MTSGRRWLVLAFVAVAPLAFAWNETGHMIAALIAYDQMSEGVRDTTARLLRAHPRFREDFEPRLPRSLRLAPAAEQNRWYFAFAATWPDSTRRFARVRSVAARETLIARFNRGSWHYINLPVFLQSTDRRRLDAPVPTMAWAPDLDETDLNIVQALELLTARWCDEGDADRALALSWISHLIADLHQPLHATSMFALPALPRGDRGGNDILIASDSQVRADNLHALWDGALGAERRWRQLNGAARSYGLAWTKPDSLPTSPIESPDAFRSQTQSWAKKSRAIAGRVAYTADIRAAIADATHAGPVSVRIGSDYRDAMRSAVEQQIGIAGTRMSGTLSALSAGVSSGACTRRAH